MIVAFPPGGVADITGRPTAAAMEKILKQPVAVVNRPGAAGAVGNAAVANAKPDGYTILMALSSISVIPAADELFNRKPAYALDQFAPIALISADPTILVVHPSLPVKTPEGAGGARKIEAGPDVVLVVRRLRRAAHADGDVPARGEAEDAARADHRRRPGHHRAARRARRDDRRRSRGDQRPREERQDAPDRGLGGRAASFLSRRADVQGAGLQGRGVLHLGRPVRARAARRTP